MCQAISENQWDDFLAFVDKQLEENPVTKADTLMAYKLGWSIYSHYNSWQYEAINIANPQPVKIGYLLNYWKQKRNHASMRAMVMDLDEKLKPEPSFNLMREQIKQRFL